MENTKPHLLGTDFTAIIAQKLSDTRWSLSGLVPDVIGEVFLITRNSELYRTGDEIKCWLFNSEKDGVCLLTDSSFGRLPISNRMRPRYLRALLGVGAYLRNPREPKELLSHLAEVKGMFNRSIRKDQWDWLEVYHALGSLPYRSLRKAVEYLSSLQKSVKAGSTAENRNPLLLQGKRLESILSEAYESIRSTAPKASKRRLDTGRITKASTVSDLNAGDSHYVLSQSHRAKLERANSEHQKCLSVLLEHLESQGYVSEQTPLLDAYATLKSGPAIFEVKSINPSNERSQCRHALSQLYEYRYLFAIPEATLWIVFSARPANQWLVDYLEVDRDIRIIWVDKSELHGPSVDKLM